MKTEPLLGGGAASSASRRALEAQLWRAQKALFSCAGLELLLVVIAVLWSYDGSFSDFWKDHAESYDFRSSVLDVLALSLVRAALCAVAAFVKREQVATPVAAYDLAVLLVTVVKACLFRWPRHVAHASPSLVTASMATCLLLSLVDLGALVWLLRGLRDMEDNRARYAKLQLEEDVEQGKQTGDEEPPPPPLTVTQLLKILRPYFWPSSRSPGWLLNRVRCISTWVFVTGSKVCSVFSPIFIARATTDLTNGDYHHASYNAGIYCLLVFLSKALKECQNLVYLEVKKVAYGEITSSVFEHLLNLSLQWHLKKKIGQVIRSMDRGTDAADTVVTYLFLYLVPAMGEALATCLIFFLHFRQWKLAVILVASLILYAYATIRITLWRRKLREATNKRDNEIHERATDSLINYETVKCFSNEPYELQRFNDAVRAYQHYSITVQASLSLLNVIQQVIVSSCTVGTLLVTAYAVANGDMVLGDFVAVNVYTSNAFQPLAFLGTVYTAVVKALIDMQNLNQLLLEQPDVTDLPNAPPLKPPASNSGVSVQFNDVCFSYPGQGIGMGLKNVSFDVAPGTTTAIVGHTGSGKTTIARLLFRFYDPKDGCVRINGVDVREVQQRTARGLIGVVPQDTCLFNDTILHNIKYGRLDATLEEVDAAVDAAQLRAFIESLPLRYETVVGERGLKLSGGEKQRVAIARCLLKNPPLVLLDEATSALDTRTERGIQEALKKLGVNRTTLVIAHRLSTIQHADQILVLDNGMVVERGSHDELMAKGGEYAHMWSLQLRGGSSEGLASLEEAKEVGGGGGENTVVEV